MTAEEVRAERGILALEQAEVTCGAGRIVVFHSAGVVALDVESAAAIYERARAVGAGARLRFG